MQDAKFSSRGIIPAATVVVTLGIDSQADGFYRLLACWGRKMELWLPLTDRITGDMRSEAPWKALSEVLSTSWLDKDGNAYRPVVCGLDIQGDFYPECLEYVRAIGGRHRLRALRGYAPQKAVSAGRSFGILRNTYMDKTTRVMVHNVDVNIAKGQLADMLARHEPGAGYVHLPCGPNGEDADGWDIETIAELTAEYRRETFQRRYMIQRWFKRHNRANHRLDCLVYALAALSLSRLKIDECALQRIEAKNVGQGPREDPRPRSKYGVQPRASFGGAMIAGVEAAQERSRWGSPRSLF
jgi:phage terminase large subunit GpA-like protein